MQSVRMKHLILVSSILLVLSGCGVKKEGGVRLANEMEDYALDYIEKHEILEPGESIVAYYDYTISLNGKEAAILTDRRLIYHKREENTVIAHADVADVVHQEESLSGTTIEVYAADGQSMRIVIAPLNGGETFYRALMNQLE